ncbi:MAG: isoprenyl transferase [Ruminococcus sp.]|nr:isoprenyl transferase [Ruminococcus sp.]
MAIMKKKQEPAELKIPVHVGIIMDGNGRWAKKRGLPRKAGHWQGARVFKTICRHAKARGIKYITFYTFSTENWKRPKEEIDSLMALFVKYFDDVNELIEEDARMLFIGDRTPLSDELKGLMKDTEERSKNCDKITIIMAINYGGRDELTHAAKLIAEDVRDGKITPEDVTPELIQSKLYTADIPDVDLIIRPSGEQRISNFLIWQSAYAEYYFDNILWPDFSKKDLDKAIEVYSERNRRFGGV